MHAEPGATSGYSWGRNVLRFVRCGTCGCIMHWERIRPVEGSRMGVNARTFEPDALALFASAFSMVLQIGKALIDRTGSRMTPTIEQPSSSKLRFPPVPLTSKRSASVHYASSSVTLRRRR